MADIQFTEEWRPVPIAPYSEWYEVSSLGRVRSKDRRYEYGRLQRGRVLAPVLIKGYHHVLIQAKPHKRMYRVHILVALAFHGEPPGDIAQNGWQVNHKNCNKLDNRPENLEWVTQRENRIHALEAGRFTRGSNSHLSKFTETDITPIREAYAAGETVMEICKRLNSNWGTIDNIVKRITWKHVP